MGSANDTYVSYTPNKGVNCKGHKKKQRTRVCPRLQLFPLHFFQMFNSNFLVTSFQRFQYKTFSVMWKCTDFSTLDCSLSFVLTLFSRFSLSLCVHPYSLGWLSPSMTGTTLTSSPRAELAVLTLGWERHSSVCLEGGALINSSP